MREDSQLDPDTLAGIASRDALLDVLFRETDRVQRLRMPLSIIVFALDEAPRFGSGEIVHALGQLVARVQRLLRSYDLFGRISATAFALGLPGCTLANAVSLAHRIRTEVFSIPYQVSGASLQLTASFGIAPSLGRSPLVVLREALQAMESARCAGPDGIRTSRLFPPAPRPADSQSALDTKSRMAG